MGDALLSHRARTGRRYLEMNPFGSYAPVPAAVLGDKRGKLLSVPRSGSRLMIPRIDFFDVDHTLTRRSSGGRFVTLAMRKGILPRRLLFLIPWYSFTYKLGLFRLRPYDGWLPLPAGSSTHAPGGSRPGELHCAAAGRPVSLGDHPRAEAPAEGRRVILATSSIDFIVAPIAEHLGVREVLATSLEFVDGVCTGKFANTPMFRREKKEQVLAFLAAEGVPPQECSFYSDSIFDLPLLEAVGTPVAVNPDFRLHRIARERGWTITDLG